MKLYHFTSPLHVDGCIKEGISKGMIPLLMNGKIVLLPGFQWLTANPNFQQEWANTEYSTLPYDRTAFRLTVVIPKTAQKQLYKWLDICGKLPIDKSLNAYGDPENWYVFKGRIKPAWIRKIEKKEATEVNMPEYEDVRPRKGGPYSLFCYTCRRWIPNTANSEMLKEGVFAHSHRCVKENGKVRVIRERGIPEDS